MPKESEIGIEPRKDVLIIPRQNVKFSNPPEPKTKEDRIKEQERMVAFIRKEGFSIAMSSPEKRCLLVDEGLGIGIFKSLEEIYDYVKKGYPAADIERYKSALAANGYPVDFHKLPFEVQRKWDELPEEVKQDIREKGVEIVEMRMIEENEEGDRIIQPSPRFKTKPDEREKTKEDQRREDEKCIKYIYKSGFKLGGFDDGKVGIVIDDKHTIGPFASLEDAVRYLKEEHHLIDITGIKEIDEPTVH